jgi:monomeric sarcosine oxidase
MIDVAVIGAGVFGAWIALRLADDGARVTLIDAFGAGNGRASSADHSRVIRAGYGADAIYSRWATESRRDWDWLANTTGRTLVTTTGALFMGEPGNVYLRETFSTLTRLGIAAEWLPASELAARFPQIDITELGFALLERDAGVLRARAAVRELVSVAMTRSNLGFRIGAVAPLDEQASHCAVLARDGSRIEADAFVFACGPWLPQLFPQAIGARIHATRQEVLYFGVPSGDRRYSSETLPVWIDFAAGLYGIADLDGQGFKVGIDRHGPSIDPDTADRIVDVECVDATRAWLARRFPGLASAPLVDSRVCQYENTSSGDFIIDRHPAWSNVWMAGGGSGHGFKHGPAVGRYVAGLIGGRVAPEPRFALANKTTVHDRLVY